MKKAVFICPFDIERLTGTPIRTKIVIKAVASFANVSIISAKNTGVGIFSLQAVRNLRILKPNIIHAFTTISVIPMIIYKIFHPRTHVIFEIHGWSWFETKGQLKIIKRIVFFILDVVGYIVANEVIVMSYTQKNYISKILYNKKCLNVIWGPVDFPIVFEEPQERDEILVGYQGNSSWWQGLHILIETTRILEKNPKIHFQLAGFDSSDKSRFPERPNINYIGRFERKDVARLIKNCDVMISPRLANKVSDLQYPQKLSEYLAGGRPVIAFDTSDQKMIIEQAKAGLIVKSESAKTLAEVIEKFIKLPAESRIKLGENAVKFAKDNFSPDVFTNKYRRAYQALD